jgi:uncharacterized protein
MTTTYSPDAVELLRALDRQRERDLECDFLRALLAKDDEPASVKFMRALQGALQEESGEPSLSLSEPKRTANGDLEINGYASVFGKLDKDRDVVDRGAFSTSIAKHAKEGTAPFMFLQHDMSAGVIGVWTSFTEDSHGLLVKGRILAGVQRGSDAIAMIEGGAVDSLSIGYNVLDSDRVGGVRHLKSVDLKEISIVIGPANTSARLHTGRPRPSG